MAADLKQAKANAEGKKEAAKQKIEAAKRDAAARKVLKNNPPPIMVEMPDSSGDIEVDSIADLDAVQQGFRNRAKQEEGRMDLAVDSEYFACICFQTREQKEAFLSALKILEFGDKYIDGQLVADRLGVKLPESRIRYQTSARVDREWLSFTKE